VPARSRSQDWRLTRTDINTSQSHCRLILLTKMMTVVKQMTDRGGMEITSGSFPEQNLVRNGFWTTGFLSGRNGRLGGCCFDL